MNNAKLEKKKIHSFYCLIFQYLACKMVRNYILFYSTVIKLSDTNAHHSYIFVCGGGRVGDVKLIKN